MARLVTTEKRRPYEAPMIFRVKIAGDELAVAGCKTASGAGPAVLGGGCAQGGNPAACKSTGS